MEAVMPVASDATVTLELEGPRPQRRWTVFFRILLAIPHFLWGWVLSIVVFFAVVAAWFGALIVGRMPEGLGTFIARVMQYLGRVNAYSVLLLTDRYPPFALDASDYPVNVRFPTGGRLNRAAVFFRGILLVPAAIAVWVVLTGVNVCLVFVWLILLVAGRLPASLFEALAATQRYMLRFWAFGAMLTSEYPRGLFGDRGLAGDMDSPVAPASAVDVDPDSDEERSLDFPSQPPAPTGPPRVTKLVLSKAAKRIVVLFIVLGVLVAGTSTVYSISQAARVDKAHRELTAAYQEVYQASVAYGSAVQSCAATQGGLTCLRDAASGLRAAFVDFRMDLGNIRMPVEVLAEARAVDDEAQDVINALDRLSVVNDAAGYTTWANELQRELEEFDDRTGRLEERLLYGY